MKYDGWSGFSANSALSDRTANHIADLQERIAALEAENAQLKTQNNVLFADLTNERQDHAIAEMYLAQLKQDAEVEKQSQQERYSALVRWCDHWEWRARRVIKIARQIEAERDAARQWAAAWKCNAKLKYDACQTWKRVTDDMLGTIGLLANQRDNAKDELTRVRDLLNQAHAERDNARDAVDVNPALPQEEV